VDHASVAEIFRTIVGLETGDALLFCPTALLDLEVRDEANPFARSALRRLKDSYVKICIRDRVTTDGGKSIMASDVLPASFSEPRHEDGSDNGSFEESGGVSSEALDSEVEVIALPASRFGRPQVAKKQRQPQTKSSSQQSLTREPNQTQQPAKAQSQQSLSHQTSKENKTAPQKSLPGPPQSQAPKAPAQQPANKQKKAQNQPAPQQDQQQLTRKQKKAQNQAAQQRQG
jgi:hypothetical protein